jgi:hypothetical protein
MKSIVLRAAIPLLLAVLALYLGLIWFRTSDWIRFGFDRKLLAISTTSAAFVSGEDHGWLIAQARAAASEEDQAALEQTGQYQMIQQPMVRVLAQSGLTYHYTTVVEDAEHIRYGVDGTTTEDHSPLGSIEENSPEELERLLKVAEENRSSVSDIQPFDRWGQLKIGTAPIRDWSGKVQGLMGADVNVSVIDEKSRLIFVQLFMIGGLAVVLVGIRTLRIAETAGRSLQNLREDCYRLAVGLAPEERKEPLREYEIIRAALARLAQSKQPHGNDPIRRSTSIVSVEETLAQPSTIEIAVPAEGDPDLEVVTQLQKSSVLSGVAPELSRLIAKTVKPICLMPHSRILSTESRTTRATILVSGDLPGVLPGSWIGLRSAILDQPATRDLVVGAHGVTVLQLERPVLLDLLDEYPSISTVSIKDPSTPEAW